MKRRLEDSHKGTTVSSTFNMEGNSVIEWISQHGEKLLYSILGLFSLLFLVYIWQSGSSTKMEGDYQGASRDFLAFQQAAKAGQTQEMDDAFQKLSLIMDRLPDLHAKYDGAIAQTLIDLNDIKQAKPLALATLQRVSKDQLPYYNEYAQITLLIEEGQYANAIQRSLSLKEKLIQNLQQTEQQQKADASVTSEPSFGSLLFAFNLLRIAFLEEHMNNNAKEIESWKEWNMYTSHTNTQLLPPVDRKAFFTIAQLYNEGALSLDSYIQTRLKSLEELKNNKKDVM